MRERFSMLSQILISHALLDAWLSRTILQLFRDESMHYEKRLEEVPPDKLFQPEGKNFCLTRSKSLPDKVIRNHDIVVFYRPVFYRKVDSR